jgi:hypothetical protein
MRRFAAMAVVAVSAVLCACGPSGSGPTTSAAGDPNPDRIVEVSTEAIATGQRKLSDLNNASLEWLYNDLRERLATDAAAHNGEPGPDAAYLASWIDKVAAEMTARGYTFTPEKTFVPPAQQPATRP